jgi:hypothetical protein
MITVRKARSRDVVDLLSNLRVEDREELEATGTDPRRAVWGSWRLSDYAQVVLVDERVAAIGGVAPVGNSGIADIWLLTTPAVEFVRTAFVKIARDELEFVHERFWRVQGFCYFRYTRALKFLRLLGFTVEDTRPFCRIWKER